MNILNYPKFISLMNNYSATAEDPIISKNEKPLKNMLTRLERLSHHDEFYTLYNLKDQKLTWCFGMDTYMGYTHRTKGMEKTEFYLGLIHPFIAEWATLFIAGMYSGLLHKKFKNVDYLAFRYIVHLPMRKKNGKYMLVKQISMPFEFDSNGRMISHISSHFIIDKYKGEPLKPRIFYQGKRMLENEKILFRECLEYVIPENVHSLSPANSILAQLILQVPQKDKSNLAKKVWQVDIANEKAKPDHKALSRLKNELIPLFEYESSQYTKQQCKELDAWLPDFHDHWTLVKFAHESRSLQILEGLPR